MIILFENKLNNEALIIKEIVEKVFGIKCKTQKEDLSELFAFKKNLSGYEIQITEKFKNKILLTEKDIFPYKSTSKVDDWIFGIATNQKQCIISIARLKTNSKNKYKSRIEFITVHELGHWLIKNQKHYKKFIWKNPKTGHKIDLGMHCRDKKCIMSEFIDVKDLDKHIKINYKNFFCKNCQETKK